MTWFNAACRAVGDSGNSWGVDADMTRAIVRPTSSTLVIEDVQADLGFQQSGLRPAPR
jgi:hypothetical protein